VSETLPDIVVEKKDIAVDDKGTLVGKGLDDQWRMAKMAIDSGMVPKAYTKPSQVVMGIQFAVGLNLPANISSLQEIAVINGKPSIFGDLPLKLVRESGKLESFREYTINKDYKTISVDNENLTDEIFAAVCVVKRKEQSEEKYFWTVEQQKKANSGVAAIWNGYFSIMMKRKARSLALKDQFSDVLGATVIAEYTHNIAPDHRDVTPRNSEANAMNKMFGDTKDGNDTGPSQQDN